MGQIFSSKNNNKSENNIINESNNRKLSDLKKINESEIANIIKKEIDKTNFENFETCLKNEDMEFKKGCFIQNIQNYQNEQTIKVNESDFIPEINDKWQESQAEKSLLENKPENNLLMIEEIKEINHEGKKAL
jgi:hypothetical protein